MNRNQEKAMFVKGRKQYVPFKMAKEAFREIAVDENLITPDDWYNFRKTNKLPRGIPKFPELVYSKSNIERNIKHGVDIKKEVYY